MVSDTVAVCGSVVWQCSVACVGVCGGVWGCVGVCGGVWGCVAVYYILVIDRQ